MIKYLLIEMRYRFNLRRIYGPPHPPSHDWWNICDIIKQKGANPWIGKP